MELISTKYLLFLHVTAMADFSGVVSGARESRTDYEVK